MCLFRYESILLSTFLFVSCLDVSLDIYLEIHICKQNLLPNIFPCPQMYFYRLNPSGAVPSYKCSSLRKNSCTCTHICVYISIFLESCIFRYIYAHEKKETIVNMLHMEGIQHQGRNEDTNKIQDVYLWKKYTTKQRT